VDSLVWFIALFLLLLETVLTLCWRSNVWSSRD
jgi:hypothetical protein